MPDKSIIINYDHCNFKQCIDGVCRAKSACEKKVLKQEAPFEPPYINTGLCLGCNKCIAECPSKAIEKTR
jgi:ferredoxin